MPADCIFCRIASRAVPSDLVYEDEEFVAFKDIHPAAPVHIVLVPKAHVATILDIADAAAMGRMFLASNAAARALGLLDTGFRTLVNYGRDGGQEVMHVHLHILGGRTLGWPPG